MRELSTTFLIPIYWYKIELVLCDSIMKAHNKPHRLSWLEASPCEHDNYLGMVSTPEIGSRCSLLLRRPGLKKGTVAHEVFHATHRVLESVGISVDENNHEAAAYLNEYITALVNEQLKQWKIKPR
jgi:hypothetical protein